MFAYRNISELPFLLGNSVAFHNHFLALWHSRTSFMACSVAAEYLQNKQASLVLSTTYDLTN